MLHYSFELTYVLLLGLSPRQPCHKPTSTTQTRKELYLIVRFEYLPVSARLFTDITSYPIDLTAWLMPSTRLILHSLSNRDRMIPPIVIGNSIRSSSSWLNHSASSKCLPLHTLSKSVMDSLEIASAPRMAPSRLYPPHFITNNIPRYSGCECKVASFPPASPCQDQISFSVLNSIQLPTSFSPLKLSISSSPRAPSGCRGNSDVSPQNPALVTT